MENYIKYGYRPNIENKKLDKACKINEIEIVRPRRENARGKNAKTSIP